VEPLVIEMLGRSIRPVCHFELPPSFYREKKAQEMTPIDANYQIFEFESLGTRVKNTKRFYTVNPTSQGYDFEWELLEE
jgi:hydrocephalus-inducing protein